MPYAGTLNSTHPFQLETSSTFVDPSVPGAVTIYYLRPGGVVDIEYALGREGPVQPARDVTVPRKVTRIVFEVTPASGGSVLLKVTQGGLSVEGTFVEDAAVVLDVV